MISDITAPDTGYTYEQLFPLLRATLETGTSVLLVGPPGIGKSTLAQNLALAMQKKLIDIRLAQKDPAELGGVYFPDRETQTLRLFPPSWVKQACDEPCFIFLDEFNAAVTKLHQAAAYQIVLEKRIGEFQFHPDTVVLAAGNREEDNAIVTPLSSALCNRFAHFEMRPDAESWLHWASENNINENIIAFIQSYGEDVLFTVSEDNAYPTPRSWEMTSRILSKVDPKDQRKAVAACIGLPMSDRFCKYTDIYRKVNAGKIITGEANIDFIKKNEPSFIYAAIFAVAAFLATAKISDDQLVNIAKFLDSPGLSSEYQILFLRQIRNRNPELLERLKPIAEFRELADKIVNLRTSLYLS